MPSKALLCALRLQFWDWCKELGKKKIVAGIRLPDPTSSSDASLALFPPDPLLLLLPCAFYSPRQGPRRPNILLRIFCIADFLRPCFLRCPICIPPFLVVFQRGLDSDPAAAVTCSSSYSLGSHPPLSSPQTKCLPTSPTLIYPLTISYSENQFCNFIPVPNILVCIISYFCVLEPLQKHQPILYCMSWPTQWQ